MTSACMLKRFNGNRAFVTRSPSAKQINRFIMNSMMIIGGGDPWWARPLRLGHGKMGTFAGTTSSRTPCMSPHARKVSCMRPHRDRNTQRTAHGARSGWAQHQSRLGHAVGGALTVVLRLRQAVVIAPLPIWSFFPPMPRQPDAGAMLQTSRSYQSVLGAGAIPLAWICLPSAPWESGAVGKPPAGPYFESVGNLWLPKRAAAGEGYESPARPMSHQNGKRDVRPCSCHGAIMAKTPNEGRRYPSTKPPEARPPLQRGQNAHAPYSPPSMRRLVAAKTRQLLRPSTMRQQSLPVAGPLATLTPP
mmetsp:Transcript_115962/g.247836  ORF Transcript_115962/g.247836 Transcript_115962/m.247836 type:complete len:304 (-) Transcript_115962:286-1197(-)